MRKVMILTDSSSDLTQEELDLHKIGSIPIYVRFKDEIYHDHFDIKTEEMYEKIKSKKEMPEIGAILMSHFIAFFEKYLEKGYDVIYICMGSKLSDNYKNAVLAREELDLKEHLYLVDSKNVSSGLAMLVLKAKDLRNQGYKAKEIKEIIEGIVPNIRSLYVLSSRSYFDQNFKIRLFARFLTRLFGQKIVISVRYGQFYIHRRPKGNLTLAVIKLLKEFYKDVEKLDPDYAYVTHSLCNRQAIFVTQHVKKYAHVEHFIEAQLGCVVSSFTGPGTIGIIYAIKN